MIGRCVKVTLVQSAPPLFVHLRSSSGGCDVQLPGLERVKGRKVILKDQVLGPQVVQLEIVAAAKQRAQGDVEFAVGKTRQKHGINESAKREREEECVDGQVKEN